MNGGIETALVVGATSDIGRAIARRLAEGGCALQLAARDPARLERETRDLRARMGGAVTAHRCDVLDEDGGVSLLDALDPLPAVAVCVVGMLGDQAESQRDGGAAERVMRTNESVEARSHALREWRVLSNERRLVRRHRHRSPAQVRREFMPPSAAA